MSLPISALVLLHVIAAALNLPARTLSNEDKVYTAQDGTKFRVETVLENLVIPWSIVFDDAGNLYFTERPGRLQVLRKGAKARNSSLRWTK